MKLKKINEEHYVVENNDGVITHSTDINFNEVYYIPLSEVKELLGEVDVQIKAEKEREKLGYTNKFINGFVSGYTQAIEDNKERKYTEDDMRKAWNAAYIDAMSIDEETYKPLFFEDFIQSLQSNTEWEVEFINGKLTLI